MVFVYMQGYFVLLAVKSTYDEVFYDRAQYIFLPLQDILVHFLVCTLFQSVDLHRLHLKKETKFNKQRR